MHEHGGKHLSQDQERRALYQLTSFPGRTGLICILEKKLIYFSVPLIMLYFFCQTVLQRETNFVQYVFRVCIIAHFAYNDGYAVGGLLWKSP